MEEINNVSGQQPETTKTLTKANFLLMGVSVVMIIVGFLLMGGEPIFSAPCVLLSDRQFLF